MDIQFIAWFDSKNKNSVEGKTWKAARKGDNASLNENGEYLA
jgi:hypothetical protein